MTARDLLAAATPGPWTVDGEYDHGGNGIMALSLSDDETAVWVVEPAHAPMESDADAALIAHMRTAYPAALDALDRVRAELNDLIDSLDDNIVPNEAQRLALAETLRSTIPALDGAQ